MTERTFNFRRPGFFEAEIDLTQKQEAPSGVGAGIIGTAERGPAFVPVTVGSFADFKTKFGSLDHKKFGPYAVNEFLKNKNSVTYVRVLGAGANQNSTDINNTLIQGVVKNAGFKVVPSVATSHGATSTEGRHAGSVQFIVAKHLLSGTEALGFPVFTDNDSFNTTGLHTANDTVNLVRAMVMMASGTRMMLLDGNEATPDTIEDSNDTAGLAGSGNAIGKFKLVLSSSAGTGFGNTDNRAGLKIFTASLNPSEQDYIGNILNKDPERFGSEEHLLYADFAVEDELATISYDADSIAVLSGSTLTSPSSGDTSLIFREMFGRFDTRYKTPQTPWIISQPFGKSEFNLFRFETLSDGAFANNKYKVSVSNIRGSTDEKNKYGTFTVLIRNFDDTDLNPEIIEQFPNCSLNPNSDNYIAKLIGDKKVSFNFDAETDDERRLIISGKYPNKSNIVRIIMSADVEQKDVPETSLPFGFRGVEALKTNDTLTDTNSALGTVGSSNLGVGRLAGLVNNNQVLTASIVPPVPFRFKVTRGQIKSSIDDGSQFAGTPGVNEIVDTRLYWGVKFERVPETGSLSNAILNTNVSSVPNPLISTYTKMLGISKLDALTTGSGADLFNNNKFSLSKVAFANTTNRYADTELTGTAAEHIKDAAYVRNGDPDPNEYKVNDGVAANRITLGTLVAQTSSITFNKFSDYNKFTTFFVGGFDGVNILDKEASKLNDRAGSSDTGGQAASSFNSPGLSDSSGNGVNAAGTGKTNNTVFSYRTAVDIITDPMSTNINILAIPGIRDSFITDRASDRTKEYQLAMYVMDIPYYDEDSVRLFDDMKTKPDVEKTTTQLETRALDNNYTATYFPDVVIEDEINMRKVKVPASIAALSALGFNDRISFPWFAPAGFNRGALDFVSSADVGLRTDDINTLYDARINPIASFPREGFVIFGQKTLQQAQSALDRVNVRRLNIEIKRLVIDVARKLVFEQNNNATRSRFKSQVIPKLAIIQANSGIDNFKVVMDETNNTKEDEIANRLNGIIAFTPVRAVEFIQVDFIITNSGVSFV